MYKRQTSAASFASVIFSYIRYPVVPVCKNVLSPNQPIKNRNSRDIFYSPLHNGCLLYTSPVWTVENGIVHVKVGSVEHPMLPEHYIEWVSLHTKQGNQRKELHPGEKPEVCFALCEGDAVEAVYAYCNLHSLWKA